LFKPFAIKTSALTIMILTQVVVAGSCSYFFYRILNSKPKEEKDE
jgi:hypothetical protein